MLNPTQQFSDAIKAAGLIPPDAIEPGKFHKFPGEGKGSRNKAGWCKLFNDGVGGIFGDYASGLSTDWQAQRETPYSEAERQAFRQAIADAKKQAEAEQKARNDEAADKAKSIWQKATPAPDDHPYLLKKGIKPNGAKLLNNALLIPMRADGDIHSLQFIGTDGDKKFLFGGRIKGCYFSVGNPNGAAALCIAEGFATGATIHESTGYPVAIAFNAGNLGSVAKAMRDKFPDLPLILCADDDYRTEGNPGLTKATEAARAVGGLLAVPDFGSNRPDGMTDFNDMATLLGVEAVRLAIVGLIETGESDQSTALINPEVSQVSEVQANNYGPSADTPPENTEVSEVSAKAKGQIPDMDERPRFCVFDDWIEASGGKLRPGVWFFGIKPAKGESPPTPTQSWICSPLHVEAITFDGQDNNFGRLLRFKNTLGRWREWAMPMELLKAGGDDLRGELLAMGVEIDPSAKTLLTTYLQSKPPRRRMRCALQVGWCDGSFVLPDAVIGPKASGVIFQSGERGHDEHTKAGTLAGWQTDIAALAINNPLLTLALSASFAGPMLDKCNAEGGGVHFVGDSSTGKTTLLEAGCSIWGGANYRRSWRATANGMEGAAALFNDCLLALDEISECDPREVGAIVYSLGNGRGKQRAGRSGNARGVTRWRCIVLSSGERSIATAMAEGGHRAKAGQAVRLLDIPAARTFGAWDDLHGLASGTAFSDAIKRASVTHHGHAGRAFLEKMTRDSRDFCALLETVKSLPHFAADGGEGQDKRAAGRFALLALAGEVATEYGITGWPEGEAIKAASECFKLWRASRGKGNDERRQILDKVSGFIERHGDGRFSDADATGESNQLRDRAGWWRNTHDGREYLFTTDGMHEALKGFDFKRALDVLQEAGALPVPGADGKRARFYRIAGRGVKLYPVQAEKLGGDHGA
jgi:putative DNA primase/helicase